MIEVVLFDLGGVLVEFHGIARLRELAGLATDDDVRARWLACEYVRAFERGACSPEAFAAGVVADWELDLEAEEFLARFDTWLGPLPEPAGALVREVRACVPVGCLSNTNQRHWDTHLRAWPLFAELDHRFLSFELGLVKPDRELFDHVADALGVPRDRVLFLDDSAANVAAAGDAGFAAEHVTGLDDARRVLLASRVLS